MRWARLPTEESEMTTDTAHAPAHALVWTEIPVRDLAAATRFYEAVFGWTLTRQSDGPKEMAVFPTEGGRGVAGHLHEGEPSAPGGTIVHLAVPGRLEDAVARCRAAGGAPADMPPVAIPAGHFAYAADPDGNALGLFEPAA